MSDGSFCGPINCGSLLIRTSGIIVVVMLSDTGDIAHDIYSAMAAVKPGTS